MADHSTSPRQRRYPPELRERTVRLVDQASAEGERHGAITRVASQLGIGPESVRVWVRQPSLQSAPAIPTMAPPPSAGSP